MTDTITLRRPDDWHVHLRDGDMLARVARATARQFARAIVMPNLAPPVTSVAAVRAYRDRIMAALPRDTRFTPLMTAYLTDDSDPEEIARGAAESVFTAVKLYPANATTNSAHGVTSITAIRRVLEAMEAIGLPLLVHGEVTDADIDIFDREAVFIDRVLEPLLRDMPGLRVVFEHVTTADAIAFVESADADIAATITPHHLHINRNAMLVGGVRPHAYCLPVAKREAHRLALRKAATGTSARFFLGTDSAPHERAAKESACGCAGIFNAPFAIESYAQVFDDEDALDRLEAFASLNGPAFYRLPSNEERITLKRGETRVPDLVEGVVPFHAGETLGWSLA